MIFIYILQFFAFFSFFPFFYFLMIVWMRKMQGKMQLIQISINKLFTDIYSIFVMRNKKYIFNFTLIIIFGISPPYYMESVIMMQRAPLNWIEWWKYFKYSWIGMCQWKVQWWKTIENDGKWSLHHVELRFYDLLFIFVIEVHNWM